MSGDETTKTNGEAWCSDVVFEELTCLKACVEAGCLNSILDLASVSNLSTLAHHSFVYAALTLVHRYTFCICLGFDF